MQHEISACVAVGLKQWW